MDNKKILKHRWMKPLIQEARRLGYKVRLVPDSRDIGLSDAYGCHQKGLLTVVLKDHQGVKMSIADITWVLAHEVRHAQHVATGAFSRYYNDDNCDLDYGLKTERNCDAYADNYVDGFDDMKVKPRMYKRDYPVHKVSGYEGKVARINKRISNLMQFLNK